MKGNFNKYFSKLENLIQLKENKNIIVIIEEVFHANKIYLKHLNLTLSKKESNEVKEIISKKIYVLNIEYYLTKGFNHERINSIPFLSYINNDYFNKDDIINLINKENLLQIYNIDEYRYFNDELGCFVDIKNETIEIKEKNIFEFHISDKKKINYNLNQIKKYFDEEIFKMKYRINKFLDILMNYDLIFLYASPIIKNEYYKEFNAPISYMEEIRKIIKLMNYNDKKLNLKFEYTSETTFKDILRNNKTKVLHISAHGSYKKEQYSLVLENLGRNGQIFYWEKEKLKHILNFWKNNINKIDLIIVSTCYSHNLGKLLKECGAKYVIYVAEKTKINDRICVLFTKYFYKNLFAGKSIKQPYDNAKKEMKSNEEINELNFKLCCCNHYHKEKCLSKRYKFHNFHKEKNKCNCKNLSKPNFHNKNCKYYREFIKYLDEKSIEKDNLAIIEDETINNICCCDINIEHNEIDKIKFNDESTKFENITSFKQNKNGKSFINSTISFYYKEKKYKSIEGRKGLMGKIFENLTNNEKYCESSLYLQQ